MEPNPLNSVAPHFMSSIIYLDNNYSIIKENEVSILSKHLLDYAVIIWLIAPFIIIAVKHSEDKSTPMTLFGCVLIFEIMFQKTILLQESEWFLPNVLIHLFIIWPIAVAFYMEKERLSTLKELLVFTKPMNQAGLFIVVVPILIYAFTAPEIARDVKAVHTELVALVAATDEPYNYLHTLDDGSSINSFVEKVPKLQTGTARVLVYPHMAVVIVSGDNWREDFTYVRYNDEWRLTSNARSSFITISSSPETD